MEKHQAWWDGNEAQKTQLPPEGGRAGEGDPASQDVRDGSALQIVGGLAAELGS